jgi:FHS family L-fucose permease-like MFS transporter
MTQDKKSYALPIAMMFALFFMIAFVTGLPSPMGVIVAKQFGASNFLSQLGFFANFIAYAFMGIPAGILLERIGYKKTALIAVAVGFTGVGVQFLSGQLGSFPVYLAGAFISGFSMCMLNTVVNPMLNTLGGGGKKGNQLIQTGGSLNSVAATIVPVLVGYLMGANAAERTIDKANPALFIAMGIFAIVFVVLYIMEIPEPRLIGKVKIKHEHSPLSFRHFILGAIAIGIYVGVEIGIPSTANLFMTSDVANNGLGMDATIAGFVVGTYWFLMMIGRIVGASLGSKYTSKAMLSVAAGLGLVFVLLGILLPVSSTINMPVFQSNLAFGWAQVPVGIAFLILCGLCTSVMWGGIFNLAVEGLGKYTEAASGLFMVMVAGGGIIPLIQGKVADITSYTSSYWVIFICMAYMLFYALIGSKNVNKDIPVEVTL